MNNKEQVWHREVITPQVEQTLVALQGTGFLSQFYLAGGTGLALHLGHRRSQDLDFFSTDLVQPDALIERLQTLEGFSVVSKGAETLHVTVQGVKVSFLGYVYPILFPMESFLRVNVADPRDIAGMKISAIAGRGTKRDFVDLYLVSREYGLRQTVEWFQQKFAQANYSRVHILKSLTYFEDADKDPMPDMLIPLSWNEVKQFFSSEVPRLS
ncbi:MAG: nucleotidyl transferase AbiEii/AbiGii toxin family protein [Acidobacteriia bacterium]|nr:nucleotidyl transferase AbiEii/AbiGii toxin family protein [Terriglobia bacterium]